MGGLTGGEKISQALSSIFFVHDRQLLSTSQFNFASRSFVALRKEDARLEIFTELNGCGEMRKEKFSRDFWPTLRWGRKGYLHAKWKMGGRWARGGRAIDVGG